MKKIKLLLVLFLIAGFVFAQKAKVSSANSALSSGKLDKAKLDIDAAFDDPKIANDPRAYFVKGQIYQAIAEDATGIFSKLDENAAQVALDAYEKATQYDEKGKYKKKIDIKMKNMDFAFAKMGEAKYGKGEFEGAMKAFRKSQELSKKEGVIDTAMYFNVALTATKSENYDIAIEAYLKTLELKYRPAFSYSSLARLYKQMGETDKSNKYLKEGFDKYPDNENLLFEIINYYMDGKNYEQALKYIDKAIEMRPENLSLYRAKAAVFQKENKYDLAEKEYDKAIALDPNDFQTRYQLAFLKSDKAKTEFDRVQLISDNNLYKEETKKVKLLYVEAVPFYEKALELQPDNMDLLNNVKQLYFYLRNDDPEMMKKYEATKQKLGE